jgi:hypothetical protein
MLYKTIVLELILDRPALHERLKAQRMLAATVDRYAQELHTCHAAWTDRLTQSNPDPDQTQIKTEALELALAQVLEAFRRESSMDEDPPPSE